MRDERIWTLVVGLLGILQAWDAGVLTAGTLPLLLTVVALGGVFASLVGSSAYALRLLVLALGAGLLTVARLTAPAPLNGLHLALFPAAIMILLTGTQNQGRLQQTR